MLHLPITGDAAVGLVYLNAATAVIMAFIHFFPNLATLVKKFETLVNELDSLVKAFKKLWHTIKYPIKTRRA
jgi:hypothetical protein